MYKIISELLKNRLKVFWGKDYHSLVRLWDFHPINLVGIMYKIIAKLLKNRLKVVFGKIITPQSVFVHSQQILNPVLIANEHFDCRLKASLPSVLCKFDLEKAYNNVNWDFLLYYLRKCGFSESERSIFFCVSSTRFSVMFDCSLRGFLLSFKGLHQGNPSSTLLFEVLDILITYRTIQPGIKGH